jgi:hypothetical protein
MDWNDPNALRTASTIIQWCAIVLIFFGGGLQITKLVIDVRERRINSERAAQNERRIRSLSLQLEIDVSVKWKDGKVPDPTSWIMLSGSRAASAEFLLRDGRRISVEFHRADNLRLSAIDSGATRLSYQTTAEAASDIYTILPDDIEAVENLMFTSVFGPNLLSETKGSIDQVRATFLINGHPNLFAVDSVVRNVDFSNPTNHASGWILTDRLPVQRVRP